MPTAKNEVKLKFGTKANYTSATKNADTVYFITDTNQIYIGDKLVSSKAYSGSSVPMAQKYDKGDIYLYTPANGDLRIYVHNGVGFSIVNIPITDITANTNARHSHTNKDILDAISGTPIQVVAQTLTDDQKATARTNIGIDVLTGNTTTVTPTQVKEAILAGRPVAITYTDITYGNLTFTSFGYSLENNVIVANLVATSYSKYILADLTGIINTNGWTLQTTELGTSTDIASNYVKYSESQTLTDEQKTQARTNIGALGTVVPNPTKDNDAANKAYVDSKVASGGVTVDSSMSDTSVNPVQNKVIKKYVDDHTVVDSTLSNTSTHPVQNKVINSALGNKSSVVIKTWSAADLS